MATSSTWGWDSGAGGRLYHRQCGDSVGERPAGPGKSYPGLDPEASYFNASGNTVDLVPGASVFDICTSFGMIRQGLVKATILGPLRCPSTGICQLGRPGSYPGMGGAMDLVSGIGM